MGKKKTPPSMQWCTMDLHIHTYASSDFQQPEITFLDILHRAEARGLGIIGITDHNTVAGYRKMQEEIQQLELLEKLKRILPEEQARLADYRRLLEKILVLPGIEFTATFGFHIIGLFPPDKPVREIEFLLLDLNIPPDQIDDGSATVGATTDVLTAYRMINQAGGIVIAAHANSSNGVAMRGFPLGGQTKIAYTQDPYLHALEVTDLENKGTRSTAGFFSGAKPEYPRRMHCIQGSDSHRLTMDPVRKKNLGVGDRATDALLPEVSFDALKELFLSNDFARTRPHRHIAEPAFDFVRAAQEEGRNIIQDFHESVTKRGGKLYAIIADICAFANTNGGTLYLGITDDPKKPAVGIQDPEQVSIILEKEINERLRPPLQCTFNINETGGKKVLRVLVPRGDDPPYALDDYKIYVRSEAETALAVRDEVVEMVLRRHRLVEAAPVVEPARPSPERVPAPISTVTPPAVLLDQPVEPPADMLAEDLAPRTGVEVVSVEERDGARFHNMRDLRNGNVVKNVTRTSARRLWHYAITSYAKLPADPSTAKIHWEGNLGLLRRYRQGKEHRYDLVQREGKSYRFYFGVTDDGIHGPWRQLIGQEDD